MHDDELRAYVEELGHQHALVRLAVDQLTSASQSVPVSNVACFAAAQAILTGAAQISKLLWVYPQGNWSPQLRTLALDRAGSLREIAQVGDESVLKHRNVRNSIEHYDARLDELKLKRGIREKETPNATWAPEDKPTEFVGIIDMSIFDRSLFPFGFPIPPENVTWMRHIDPSTLEYTALDQSVSLQAVVGAVDAVALRADAWLAAHPIPKYTPGDLGDMSDIGL